MKYEDIQKTELIEKGVYKGFRYYIMSHGLYPSAYIEIPPVFVGYLNNNPQYLKVHGGITYLENKLDIVSKDKWFVGWRYNHAGDFHGLSMKPRDKKWTVKEIMKDVRRASRRLLQLCYKL